MRSASSIANVGFGGVALRAKRLASNAAIAARTKMIAVTMRRDSHKGNASLRPAAAVAKANPIP